MIILVQTFLFAKDSFLNCFVSCILRRNIDSCQIPPLIPSRIRDRLLCGFKLGFEGNSSSFVYGLVKIFSRKVNKCIRKRSRKEKKMKKIND